MKRYLTVLSSFIIMLCIGSVYSWSVIASELADSYGFTSSQSQLIFGMVIAVFPTTMIFVGQLSKLVKTKYFGYISGILFLSGYYLASLSNGDFLLILLGIGILAGIGTGFGYWTSLTSSVKWFPHKKGLITGVAAAGFGLGAVFMSNFSEKLLLKGYDVLLLLRVIGVSYGVIILFFSGLIFKTNLYNEIIEKPTKLLSFITQSTFIKLFLGIFQGTFSGLLIIGSLAVIGDGYQMSNHTLVLGVSLFAIANFLGRLIWGFVSDYIGGNLSIFLALLFQSISIILLNMIELTELYYLLIVSLIGFGFGGNFVLFAKETAQEFGVKNIGVIYPYVFLGYAIAGILGPLSGGILYDITGSFHYPIILASVISLSGSLLFLYRYFYNKKAILR